MGSVSIWRGVSGQAMNQPRASLPAGEQMPDTLATGSGSAPLDVPLDPAFRQMLGDRVLAAYVPPRIYRMNNKRKLLHRSSVCEPPRYTRNKRKGSRKEKGRIEDRKYNHTQITQINTDDNAKNKQKTNELDYETNPVIL